MLWLVEVMTLCFVLFCCAVVVPVLYSVWGQRVAASWDIDRLVCLVCAEKANNLCVDSSGGVCVALVV